MLLNYYKFNLHLVNPVMLSFGLHIFRIHGIPWC
jgi:hypothetical protein